VTALLGRRAWWPGHGGDSDENTKSRWAEHSYAESYYTPPTEHSRW
jgi:RND superfamily putative drug exporter